MPSDRGAADALRAFRRNAVHVRPALRAVRESGERRASRRRCWQPTRPPPEPRERGRWWRAIR